MGTPEPPNGEAFLERDREVAALEAALAAAREGVGRVVLIEGEARSEEHTSELQSQ